MESYWAQILSRAQVAEEPRWPVQNGGVASFKEPLVVLGRVRAISASADRLRGRQPEAYRGLGGHFRSSGCRAADLRIAQDKLYRGSLIRALFVWCVQSGSEAEAL